MVRAGGEEKLRLLAARPELEFFRGRGWHGCGVFPDSFATQSAPALREPAGKDIHSIGLNVQGVDVGDRELASLCGLPRLDALQLLCTSVTDNGLAALLEFDEFALVELTGRRSATTG